MVFLMLLLIFVVLIIVSLVVFRVIAPPDMAYIISGLKKRIIIGKSSIRIPILERLDKLNLRVMSVDVKTGGYVPTNDYMNVKVDGIVKIQIPKDLEMIEKAAQNFLNQKEDYIVLAVQDVLEGNMRERSWVK